MKSLFKNIKLIYGTLYQNIILDSNFNISSSNLLLNLDSLGDELITNGDLSSHFNWILSPGITYNTNGYLDFNLSTGQVTNTSNITFVQGKIYKLVYEIKNYVNGSIKSRFKTGFNTISSQQSGNGLKTEYLVCNDSSNNSFQFFGSSSFIGSIDNISVQQLYANWNTTGDFNIDSSNLGSITCTGTGSLIQNDILEINQQYQITINYQNTFSVFSPFYVESKNNTTFNASPHTDKLVFEFTASKPYLELNGNFQGLITKITAIKI